MMYNLEVAQDHTFTVGAGQWIVHNCGTNNWIKQLPSDPQKLVDQGWKDVTHPKMVNRSEFIDPETGRKVAFDTSEPGKTGFRGQNHYHVYNPESTGNRDLYLDIDGNPVPKNSKPSHILPSDDPSE